MPAGPSDMKYVLPQASIAQSTGRKSRPTRSGHTRPVVAAHCSGFSPAARLDQSMQPARQNVRRNAEAFAELAKPRHAAESITQDQDAPPFADPIQAPSDGTLHGAEADVLHDLGFLYASHIAAKIASCKSLFSRKSVIDPGAAKPYQCNGASIGRSTDPLTQILCSPTKPLDTLPHVASIQIRFDLSHSVTTRL